ncbi:hypothetical protein KC929_00275 [Patescibacteria group bacterium]|nr:hypothetical protein [Patescibacteria group bacterium]
MKTYINTILVSSVLLLLFPFLGFGEIIEYLYVIILGCIIGLSALFLRHKSGLVEEVDEATSLEDYVKELQERFKEHAKKSPVVSNKPTQHESTSRSLMGTHHTTPESNDVEEIMTNENIVDNTEGAAHHG